MTDAQHLVVAFNFPPFVDASAVTQAKRIATTGDRVDVVSQDLTGLRARDDSLLQLVAPLIGVHDIISGVPSFVGWPSLRSFTASGMRRLSLRGPLSRYATVYSRSMWPHSHVLAAFVKVVHPEVQWSAEFSDPLLHHVDGSRRRSPELPSDDSLLRRLIRSLPPPYQSFLQDGGQVLHLIQALPFALADTLVFTNPQQRSVMLGDLPNGALASSALRRSVLAPHPVPPTEWVPPHTGHPLERTDRRRIGYFGTLYPNRGLGSIAEAIRLLPQSLRSNLRIDVYTAQRERSYAQVKRCGVGDVIRLLPELPYRTFLQLASTYDHLLVTDTRTGGFEVTNPFLPSKVSDYAATGVNIMSITVPGSELSKRDYRPNARVDDVVSIRDAFASVVTNDLHRTPGLATSQ